MAKKQYAFSDVEFMTGAEKEKVLRAWIRFLKNGLRRKDFTDRLYRHLTLHCSFIAHYNIDGFYNFYFSSGDRTRKFLSQFDSRGPCKSVEYNGDWWLYSDYYEDLNRAMIDSGAEYIPGLMEKAASDQEASDIALARALLAKHGKELPV